MANIIDVAKHANVSAMTVSRVINQSGYVKEETRERVLAAMKELNYIPNGLARSLVRQRTHTLALIVPDITNPFFTTVARGTEDAARKSDYRVILCNSDENLAKEREYIETCLDIRVDGVIVAATGDQSRDNLALLSRLSIPLVLIDRDVDGIQADLVTGDSYRGAKSLVEHLIAFGHQNIALVGGFSSISTGRDRLHGYLDALKDSNLAIRPEYIHEASYIGSLPGNLIDTLLSSTPRPTAIFCANNFVAAKVVQGLRSRGLKVPEDVAITCFDDVDPLHLSEPFFTVAAQPAYEFGSLAVDMLIGRISGDALEPKRITLQPDILLRPSSGRPITTRPSL